MIVDLMVIVEYCPFGNLQSFLAKNRRYFVDQIVPNTDEIDFEKPPIDIPNPHDRSSIELGRTSLEPMLQYQKTTAGSKLKFLLNL